jgi:hypothetical protein
MVDTASTFVNTRLPRWHWLIQLYWDLGHLIVERQRAQGWGRSVSTRAFLLFLEQEKLISSSVEVERRAIAAGRMFSQVRFPP